MKTTCRTLFTFALTSAALVAMAAACTVDPNTARRKTGTTRMLADTGVSMSLDSGVGGTADTGTGNANCDGNPSMCVAHELRSNPPTCACLGVCEQGWQWQTATNSCVQNGMMTNPDGGTPPGPSVDGGVPSTDPFNPAVLAATYARTICQRRTRCEPAFHDYLETTEAGCITDVTAQITSTYSAFADIIGSNRLGFSQSKFDNCQTAMAASDCILGTDPAACSGIFTGSQGTGQPCALQAECVDGNFCAINALGDCATCRATTPAGGDCSATVCAEGTTCLTVSGQRQCIPDTADVGQPCNTVQAGLCRGRLQCVGMTTFTCARPVNRGDMCPTADAMGNVPSGTCNIYQNDVCVNNACVPAIWGGAGNSCNDPATANACNGSARCDAMSMQCVAYPGMGETCFEGNCADGYYCDVSTCAPQKMNGTSCQASAECSDDQNLYCVNNTCGAYSYSFCP
jgi:hypothetical protein